MGFGPKMPDVAAGVEAVKGLIAMQYPDRATPQTLNVIASIADVLLAAGAALSFDNIERFLNNPTWREEMLQRHPHRPEQWNPYRNRPIAPQELDDNFAWILHERLQANRASTYLGNDE